MITSVAAWLAVPVAGAVLLAGAYAAGVLDVALGRLVAGAPLRPADAAALPVRRAAHLLVQQRSATERPDAPAWLLAPALYGGLAAAALTVVPLAEGWAIADVRAGIVLFGAAEALAIVAVYLHGWSANSYLPLVGAYRFVAEALSYELLSMFVLIAAALPAESLQVSEIVLSQERLWNVVRHPPGLPLWIIVSLGVAFWGPMNLPDGDDLAGGTSAETSGIQRLAWQAARGAMLVTFSAMGAAVFLGGWLGPWLPGWLWMAVKTGALLAVIVLLGHVLARFRIDRFVTIAWTVLLPIAFLDLVIAGVEALP